MAIKVILILSALIMVGCSVFPNTTTVSASSKANDIDNPTLKVNQTFKWSKE
jgi:PBP1b-binding outer membrane lipoprotein LpoB